MKQVRQVISIILSSTLMLGGIRASANQVQEDKLLNDMQKAYQKVYGNKPGEFSIQSRTIDGITTYYTSIKTCDLDRCRPVYENSFRESVGNIKVDGKIYIAETLDSYRNDLTFPLQNRIPISPDSYKRVDFVIGYAEDPSYQKSTMPSFHMRIGFAPNLLAQARQFIPAAAGPAINAYNDLQRAIYSSAVLRETYENSLHSQSNFNEAITVFNQNFSIKAAEQRGSLAIGLGLMSKQIDTTNLSAQQIADIDQFTKIKNNPLTFKQHELTEAAAQDLTMATRQLIKEKNVADLVTSAEVGFSQIDSLKAEAFAKEFDGYFQDGIVQVEKVKPEAGTSPLDRKTFKIPAQTHEGQALRRVANSLQTVWAETKGLIHITREKKTAFLLSLALLESAEGAFHKNNISLGFQTLYAVNQHVEGMMDGLIESTTDFVESVPAIVKSAIDLAQAIQKNPDVVYDLGSQLLLNLPEIADQIKKSMITFGQEFLEGDTRTRGEMVGHVLGQVLTDYLVSLGTGKVMKIGKQALGPSIEGLTAAAVKNAVVLEPKVAQTIINIQKAIPPGANWEKKYNTIVSSFSKIQRFSPDILPDMIQHRRLLAKIRDGYNFEISKIRDMAAASLKAGKSLEETARQCHAFRRNVGIYFKDMTPQPLRDAIYGRNLGPYSTALGPTFDDMMKHALSKGYSKNEAFEYIIKASQRTNPELNDLIRVLTQEIP
ncbi:MAG: hypothetical protein HUU45_05310 [Leptospiraceae bacterium]|nr:hypothetical protein [Leptospiraceae bacterium]